MPVSPRAPGAFRLRYSSKMPSREPRTDARDGQEGERDEAAQHETDRERQTEAEEQRGELRGETDENQELMDDPEPDVEVIPNTNVKMTVRAPTLKEREEHNVTHLPYRSWCRVCVAARAVDDAHRHRRPDEVADEAAGEIPKVYFDYGFFRTRVASPQLPFLVMTCKKTGMRRAVTAPDRTGRNQGLINVIEQYLREMGHHGPVVLRSDGEHGLGALLQSVAESRRTQTHIERGPRGDGQANGRAERTVRAIEEIVRVLKADLERRADRTLNLESNLFTWLLRHGADLLNKRQPGFDGKTAFERMRGRVYRGELMPFCSPVLHRLSGKVIGGVLVDRWHKGFWLGKTSTSDEHVIGLENGNVIRARSVRSLDEPLDIREFSLVRPCGGGQLTTMNMDNIDESGRMESAPPNPLRGRPAGTGHNERRYLEGADPVSRDQRPFVEPLDENLKRERELDKQEILDKRRWGITAKMLKER